jgi:hypothetical protein
MSTSRQSRENSGALGLRVEQVLVRAHVGDRQLAQHRDVDQARVVAVDPGHVGVGSAPAQRAGAEVLEGVDALDLLEGEHIRFELADRHPGERFLVD